MATNATRVKTTRYGLMPEICMRGIIGATCVAKPGAFKFLAIGAVSLAPLQSMYQTSGYGRNNTRITHMRI
jgi:hypothetical protein